MAITTTENFPASVLRCEKCSGEALALLLDANGKGTCVLCATGSMREELLRLHEGLPAGTVPVRYGGGHVMSPLDPLGRFEEMREEYLPHLQTLEKAPAPPHQETEIAPEAPDDGTPLYVSKYPKRTDRVEDYESGVRPAYGRGGQFLGGGRKSR